MSPTAAPSSASVSEATPLLNPTTTSEEEVHDAIYSRFTPARKRAIVALLAAAGFVPFLVTGSLVPSIPKIVEDLDSTPSIVSQAITLSFFGNTIGNLWWAKYCGFYGRRPIYLFSLPVMCIGCIGVAFSHSIPALFIWRIVQAFGSSSGMSVGASVIGDIYKLEERGSAMGIFFGAVLMGPAVAPFLGGAAAQYASWRWFQLFLAIMALLASLLMYIVLPETAHPGSRGFDKMIKAERAAQGIRDDDSSAKFRWVWLNPFNTLKLLRAPNLFLPILAGALVLLTDFAMFIPLSYTIGARYGISNPMYIGLLFLPVGLGNMSGAPLAGRLSDHTVVRWRAKRKGVWVPEDRLRATLWGAGFLAPMSVLLSGIVTHYVGGTAGIVLNLVFFFMNGVGVDVCLSPSASYMVDVLHHQSAEVMSAGNALRSGMLAVLSGWAIPAVERYGHMATNTGVAVLAWIGYALILITIRYGDRMRSSVSIPWSTSKDN